MGKEPFPPARGPGSVDTVATEEQARAAWGCVWAYRAYWASVATWIAACLACQLAHGALLPWLAVHVATNTRPNLAPPLLPRFATPPQVGQCRWSYTCSVCQQTGDLLCCEVSARELCAAGTSCTAAPCRAGVWLPTSCAELARLGHLFQASSPPALPHAPPRRHPTPPQPQHPDQCGVSIHPECTGLAFPTGPYICINHEDGQLNPRARRRSARSAGLLEGAGGEEDSDSDEETASEGEGGSDAGGSSKGGKGRRKAASDSEATISEETDSMSSSGTEDEGTSKRRRKR